VACDSRNTKLAELRFRASLTEHGTRQIELARSRLSYRLGGRQCHADGNKLHEADSKGGKGG
jgi:hypothetical protein